MITAGVGRPALVKSTDEESPMINAEWMISG